MKASKIIISLALLITIGFGFFAAYDIYRIKQENEFYSKAYNMADEQGLLNDHAAMTTDIEYIMIQTIKSNK